MLHLGVQKEPKNDSFGGQNLKENFMFYIDFLPLINASLWENVMPPGGVY